MESGVYVIQEGNSNHYKIGMSEVGPQARLSKMQVGNSSVLSLVVWIPSADFYLLEKSLHERFSANRIRGEWFELDTKEVEYLKSLSEDHTGPDMDADSSYKYQQLLRGGVDIANILVRVIDREYRKMRKLPIKIETNDHVFIKELIEDRSHFIQDRYGKMLGSSFTKIVNSVRKTEDEAIMTPASVYQALRHLGFEVKTGRANKMYVYGIGLASDVEG